MAIYDKSIQWEYYLARPFTLFGASLWHYWYTGDQFKKAFGLVLPDVLYVEEPLGVMRSYRRGDQLAAMREAFNKLVNDEPERCIQLLHEGERLNEMALEYVATNPFRSWEEVADFITALFVHSTQLPYFAAESALSGESFLAKEIVRLGEELRAVSYYPQVYKKILTPMIEEHVRRKSEVNVSDAAELLTLDEIKEGAFEVLASRKEHRSKGDHLVLQILGGDESFFWEASATEVLEVLDGGIVGSGVVSGQVAYPGKVRGRVRIVSSLDIESIDFNDGDVLVAVSTNPNLMPLMRKCSGIVTDEGGLLSHAAIVSRELKKPCIIGTRIATQVLKDGDIVEVDADKGVVRILK